MLERITNVKNIDTVEYVLSNFDDVQFVPHSYYNTSNEECRCYISSSTVTVIDGAAYCIVCKFYNDRVELAIAGLLDNIGVYNKTEIYSHSDIDKQINTFKMRLSRKMYSLDEFSNISRPTLTQASIIIVKILGNEVKTVERCADHIVYSYRDYSLKVISTKRMRKMEIYFKEKRIHNIKLDRDFASNLLIQSEEWKHMYGE